MFSRSERCNLHIDEYIQYEDERPIEEFEMNKRWLKDVDLGLTSIQNTRKKKLYKGLSRTSVHRSNMFFGRHIFLLYTDSHFHSI